MILDFSSTVTAALAPDFEARDLAAKLLRPELDAAATAKIEQPNAETRAALSRQAKSASRRLQSLARLLRPLMTRTAAALSTARLDGAPAQSPVRSPAAGYSCGGDADGRRLYGLGVE